MEGEDNTFCATVKKTVENDFTVAGSKNQFADDTVEKPPSEIFKEIKVRVFLLYHSAEKFFSKT